MVNGEEPKRACLTKVLYVPLFPSSPANIDLPNINSFSSSWELHFFPLKPQTPTLFLVQNDTYTSFSLTAFGISKWMWISCLYKSQYDLLLLIGLISI